MENHKSITVARELVTPQTAESWLAVNEANRPLRRSSVSRLADDMEAGLWIETNPQPLIFDPSGALIDGQHRLQALVKSGRSISFWVARNVPRPTQLVIDDHIRRQVHDFAKWEMPGHNLTGKHVAIARVMMDGLPGSRGVKASRSVLYQFMRQHLPAIEFSLSLFSRRIPNITTATTLAVIARASYSQAHLLLRRFAEVMENGQMASPTESAAVSLGRWLLERRRSGSAEIYGKTERALLSFLKGEALSKVYAAKEELFPISGQTGTDGDDMSGGQEAADDRLTSGEISDQTPL